jgi:D-sedoheptulose 7-phosphate isomerase
MQWGHLSNAHRFFQQSQEALQRAVETPDFVNVVTTCADRIECCFRQGGKLLIAGNGGSAADAQHIAGEFVSRMNFDRSPLPAIALTTDGSVLTAISNDYGFEHVFGRQIRGLGRRGDVFLAISTSGSSPNILYALEAARQIDVTTIGFTGSRGVEMASLCDLAIIVPSDVTRLIQEVHITAAHVLCELIEASLFRA